MDYSDLMSSVINENENMGNAAMAGKQILANAKEGISSTLTDIGQPAGVLLAAYGGITNTTWVAAVKNAVSSGASDTASSTSLSGGGPALGLDGATELTDMSSVGVDAAVDTGVAVAGTTGWTLAGTVGAAVPIVGVALVIGSAIASAVEAFEGHHETDSAPVNLGDLTSLAFDPSST